MTMILLYLKCYKLHRSPCPCQMEACCIYQICFSKHTRTWSKDAIPFIESTKFTQLADSFMLYQGCHRSYIICGSADKQNVDASFDPQKCKNFISFLQAFRQKCSVKHDQAIWWCLSNIYRTIVDLPGGMVSRYRFSFIFIHASVNNKCAVIELFLQQAACGAGGTMHGKRYRNLLTTSPGTTRYTNRTCQNSSLRL